MRAFAITGIVTASWISRILAVFAMRATPPSARMSAGTRSSAITAQAPACSAIRGLLGVGDVHDHAALEHLGKAALDPECGFLTHGRGSLARSEPGNDGKTRSPLGSCGRVLPAKRNRLGVYFSL